MKEIRHRIHPHHPIFGDKWMLKDEEIIKYGDETGYISTLLNVEDPERWERVAEIFVGKSVKQNCDEDMDGHERVFRRGVL